MLFKDILGGENIKKELVRSIKNKRVAHAQLFLGDDNSQKLMFALAFAQFLNCEERSEDDSCQECNSCIKYEKLIHPDLHLIFPIIKISGQKKTVSASFLEQWREQIIKNPHLSLNEWALFVVGQNKSGKQVKIYKDQAEEIQKNTTLKNFESKYRVILIWMPEMMNIEASNKLLKLLEEPPKGTVFLFVSKNPSKLLPTVKSRLQTIIVPSNPTTETKNNQTIDFFEDFSKWMRILYKLEMQKIIEWSEQKAKEPQKQQELFCVYSIGFIRKCILNNFTDKENLTTPEIEKKFLEKFALFIHEENIILIVEKLEETIRSINRNGNAKIIFFELSLQIARFLKVKRKFATN